jgi:hypothetical protein
LESQIIAVFCLCDDLLRAMRHQEDRQCEMSDAEVMTVAVVAALYFGSNYTRSRWMLHDCGYIPRMLEKSRFSRRLHRVKSLLLTLFNVLGETWKEMNDELIYSIDTFPVPVCDNYRIRRSKLYRGEAYRGYVASKKRFYYGIKVHLLMTKEGEPVEFFLTPGADSDVGGLDLFDFDLPPKSTIYADRIYNDYELEDVMEIADLHFQPMRKKNSKRPFPPYIQFLQHHHRKRIETAISVLEQSFPRSIHATSAEGFELKIVLFLLAFSVQLATR